MITALTRLGSAQTKTRRFYDYSPYFPSSRRYSKHIESVKFAAFTALIYFGVCQFAFSFYANQFDASPSFFRFSLLINS